MKTKRFLRFSVIIILVLMAFPPISVSAQSPQLMYVIQGGQTSGSCDNWENACDLQYALTSAVSGQEIWVAVGVYKPTTDPTDRAATFQLKSGVGIYGGFAGTEITRDERDWETNLTILSGDIDINDINDDGNFIAETTADIQGANVYHVVSSNFLDASAILDGFFITAGQANDSNVYDGYKGGGLYNSQSNPVLQNISFSGNLAQNGGGMYNQQASPSLTNISFTANLASTVGGGLFNNLGSPILKGILFSANSANLGGGLWNETGSPKLTNIYFISNSAAESGGGMGGYWSNPSLDNVVFYSNSANINGGGMYNWYYSNPHLSNVIFYANSANKGGGISNHYSSPTLISSILWGNSALDGPEIMNEYDSTSVISYSDVQGGWPGTSNIDTDPMFVHAVNGDLHLQRGSPAIDSGTNDGCPATDLDGVVRPQDGNSDGFYICDMGAYEVEGEPGTPPTNDNFSNASIINSLPFNDVVNNMFATVEPDEPQSCDDSPKTVWYKFTPSANAEVIVTADGSSFNDTVISVYEDTATGITGLNELNCISWGGSFTFSALEGVTYYIQAGSINSFGGELHVNIQEVFPPPNDDFVNATSISPLPFSDTVDTTWATVESDESQYCDYSPRTVWYTFTPNSNIEVRVTSEGSPFSDVVLTAYRDTGGGLVGLEAFTCVSWGGSFTFAVEQGVTYYIQAGYIYNSGELHVNLQEVPPPANDNFVNATMITSPLPFDETVDAAGATAEEGEPLSSCAGYGGPYKSIWYAYTPATSGVISANVPSALFAPVLAVYTWDELTGFTELGCQVFSGNPVTIHVSEGVTYYFQVSKLTTWDPDGTVQFHLEEIIPPVNDEIVNALTVNALPYSDYRDTSNATSSPDDPTSCSNNGSVWYRFTPTNDTLIDADTVGSDYDTVLSVFTGVPGALDQVADCCNDDYYGLQSRVTFTATAGTTYYFMVGRCCGNGGNGGGNLQLNIREVIRPANDDFGNAAIVGTLPFSDRVTITDATTEPDEPQNCYYSSRTVWYSFTPTANMLVQADMSGSSFGDTNFNVYQSVGPSFSGLNFMQCASFGNSATFRVQAGVTYYFQVGSVNGSGGDLQFNLQELPRPANDDFADVKIVDSLPFSDAVDITNATIESGEPQIGGVPPNKTIWYSITPPTTMLVQADMAGSSYYDTNYYLYEATGPGFDGLKYLQSIYYGNPGTFLAQAGVTYYIQAGNIYGGSGILHMNIKELPRPVNDDFDNAVQVSSLPFDDTVNTQYATRETGELTPSCAYYGPGTRSVWYAFTPATSGSVSANIPSAVFTPVLAVYTGNSLNNITEIGCQNYSSLMTFHVNAGTTYYFQVGNYYSGDQGGSMQFHMDMAPQPIAGFYYSPYDPSVFDMIQFYDASNDPGQVGFQSYSWDFGDGTSSTSSYPTHKYAKDGDYTVQHSVTTVDGRTASVSQVIHVKTHDVAITKINAPQSASATQTRTITVSVNSKRYAETVRVDLYKSVPGGFEFVGTITLAVPAYSTNRTTAFNFNYTFTSSDASIGKVTFKAVATIVDTRDSYPSDNEAISSPPTKISRGR